LFEKNAVDKRSRIGREIANRLIEYKNVSDPNKSTKAKIISYNKYNIFNILKSKMKNSVFLFVVIEKFCRHYASSVPNLN